MKLPLFFLLLSTASAASHRLTFRQRLRASGRSTASSKADVLECASLPKTLEVSGAGTAEANGLYTMIDNSENLQRSWGLALETIIGTWQKESADGQHWQIYTYGMDDTRDSWRISKDKSTWNMGKFYYKTGAGVPKAAEGTFVAPPTDSWMADEEGSNPVPSSVVAVDCAPAGYCSWNYCSGAAEGGEACNVDEDACMACAANAGNEAIWCSTASSAPYTAHVNNAIRGNSIALFGGSTSRLEYVGGVQHCVAACNALKDCVGFVDNYQATKPYCVLKHSAATQYGRSGKTVYLK